MCPRTVNLIKLFILQVQKYRFDILMHVFKKKGIYNYFFQSFLLELHSRVQLYFVLFQLF